MLEGLLPWNIGTTMLIVLAALVLFHITILLKALFRGDWLWLIGIFILPVLGFIYVFK